MKDILKVNNEEAKSLLLKRDSYSNISLPEYFSFQELLDKIDKTLQEKNISDFRDKSVLVFISKLANRLIAVPA